MALNRFHIVSPIALMAFSACRSPYVQGGSVGGAVVNGPLNSALVFLDYDFDGILDANEPNARTNQFGEYQLTSTRDKYDLVAIADEQTVDTSSGATFAGITLKAPGGAGVISPTSTLMQEGNLTATEVAEVLGLPDGVDPLTFNPFNVDETDAAAVKNALEVAKISKQITTAISSFASATEGAGADAADAFNTALNSVVDVVKVKAAKAKDANASTAEKILDFTAVNDLDLIKTEVTTKATNLKGLDAATLNSLAADTTSAIRNVNTKIKAVTNLNSEATKDIFSTTQVLRDQIKDVAVARKAGESGNITFKDEDAVVKAMSNKAPEAITLSGDRLISPDAGSLVVGKLATVDDQTSTAFTYRLAGKDADMFSFNAATGELSLKAKPDYSKKPFYDVTVITKDAGGKKFAETFKIDVVPEFAGLVAPTLKAASDFKQIIEQNALFKDMVNHTVLKQTADGQLVLEEKGQGPTTAGPKPIMAVVKVTERGYELHNPANDQYMSGFFKYETGGFTYSGYEVFIPNRNMLGENQKDLFKYFSANNPYGSKKLPFSERDVDFISIAGGKIVDKDGNIVSDMYGFTHYDKTMKVLGSTGIDIADAAYPKYIEVAGEFVPGVTSNITNTALTKANADAMKAVFEKAAGAVLYGEKTTTFGKEIANSEIGGGASNEIGSGISESGNGGGLSDNKTDTSAPTLNNVSIVSNNTDTTAAKAGDNVTLTFTASEAIGTPVVTFKSGGAAISDSSVTYTNTTGNTWTAVYTADASDAVGAVSFSIAFSDTASNAGTPVTSGTGSVTTGSANPSGLDLSSFKAANTISAKPGEVVKVKYDASDVGSFIEHAQFYFRNAQNQTITLSDRDNDGMATLRIGPTTMNGDYTLSSVEVRDYNQTANRVTYNLDKSTNIREGNPAKTNNDVKHNFDFAKYVIKVTDAQLPQTDFKAPVLNKIPTLDKTGVKKGEVVKVNYDASDAGSFIEHAQFYFKNAQNQQISLSDRDNDGMATFRIGPNTMNGEYTLSSVEIRDYNQTANRVTYNLDKSTNIREGNPAKTNNDVKHDFDFGSLKFTVTGAKAPQTDFKAPVLDKMPTLAKTDVKVGEVVKVNYDASDVGSFIEHAQFYFKNSQNQTITLSDRDNDGVATVRVGNTVSVGEYTLSSVEIRDYNQTANRVTYNLDKSTNIREGNPAKTNNDVKHNFDFGSLKFTVGNAGLLSDSAKPTVSKIAPEKTEAKFGEIFNVLYTADGTGSNIKTANINFYFEDKGKMIGFSDNDGDGIMSGLINQADLIDGDYKFWGYNFTDEAGNSTNIGPNSGPFKDLKITLTGAETASTDTAKPTVSKIAPEKTEAKFGEIFNVLYTADGTGSNIKSANINFYFEDKGKMIGFSDNDGDGIMSGLINQADLINGDYKFWGYNFTDEAGNSTNIGPNSGPFKDLKITLTGAQTASTDTAKPTVSKIELEKTEATFGEVFNVHYTADGTGTNIKSANINFYYEDKGKMIGFSDNDGDGIMSGLISQADLISGDYKFWGYNFTDEAGNSTNIGPNSGPFKDLKITLKMPAQLNAPQSDFEAPELISLDLLDDIV